MSHMSEEQETTETQETQVQETKVKTGGDLETVDQYKDALKQARSDAAKYRTRSKEYDDVKAKADKYEEAIKLLTGEGDPDPEKLKTEVDRFKSEAQQAKLENQLIRLASKHGADDELLIAHLSNKGLLKDADESGLDDLVQEAIKNKPNLKLDKPVNAGDPSNGGDNPKADMNSWIRNKLQAK